MRGGRAFAFLRERAITELISRCPEAKISFITTTLYLEYLDRQGFSIEIAPCGIAFGEVDCSKREGGDIKWYFASENPRFSRLDMTLETVLSLLMVLLVVSAEGNLKRGL